MGHSILPAVFSMLGSCVLRIVWIGTIFQTVGTFEMLMNVYPVSWVITGIATLIAYAIIVRKEYRRMEEPRL